jgi:hypothetical protein
MVKKDVSCHKIDVPDDVCMLRFAEYKRLGKGTTYAYSKHSYETVRGEEMIVDFDKRGKVLGIELLSGPTAKKPCQGGK